MRPSWERTWMNVAFAISERTRCDKARVGAVIVGPNQRIVSTGYNGPPANYIEEEKTCSSFCLRNINNETSSDYSSCPSIHAEMNAIAYANRRDMEGGTIYITASPCMNCAKVIANSGIKRIIFNQDKDRDTDNVVKFLIASKIEVIGMNYEKQ